LTEHLANGNFLQRIKDKKVLQKIKKLRNHTIVRGYGRNGKQALITLENYDMFCVFIEKDKDLIAELDIGNILYIEGDAIDDESLEKAGVENAKSLITALP